MFSVNVFIMEKEMAEFDTIDKDFLRQRAALKWAIAGSPNPGSDTSGVSPPKGTY